MAKEAPPDFPAGDPLPLPVVASTLARVRGDLPIVLYNRLLSGIAPTRDRRGAVVTPPTIASVIVQGEALIPREEAQRLRLLLTPP